MQFIPEQYILLFIVGITSALFYVFWFSGCNHVPSSLAGLITAFMPITTLGITYLFLVEKIRVLQLLGFWLVILSIVFNASRLFGGQPLK
ncbi:EamA family transporter [Coxiella endosymbiont of Ornithodoros maritimus]|uniref:EamA family transporter n=1 Tax=Coxiella endosymbiont of Ornithodoros maritimus TaxID=1656172 RepID=UPI002264B4EA|nr:EamA family transporter [Coxiella endosymbiont of Ornithodoros maritimus]